MEPYRLLALALAFTACMWGSSVLAFETYNITEAAEAPSAYFSKYTWHTAKHPHVASFTWLPSGDSFGTTTTGVSFRQYTIPTKEGIRVQRFEMQDHFHYIVEGAVIGSLEALSAHLAAAYNALQ